MVFKNKQNVALAQLNVRSRDFCALYHVIVPQVMLICASLQEFNVFHARNAMANDICSYKTISLNIFSFLAGI